MCFVLWVVCVSPTCFRQRQRSRPRPTEFKVALRIGGKRFSSRPLENLRAESRSLPVTSGCGRLIDRRLTQEWRRAFLFLSPSLHGSATAKQHDSACQQHAPSASSQVLVPTSTAFWSDQVDHHCPNAIVWSDCGDLPSSRAFKDTWPVRLPREIGVPQNNVSIRFLSWWSWSWRRCRFNRPRSKHWDCNSTAPVSICDVSQIWMI